MVGRRAGFTSFPQRKTQGKQVHGVSIGTPTFSTRYRIPVPGFDRFLGATPRGNYSVVDTSEYKKITIPAPTSGIPAIAKTIKDVGCTEQRPINSTPSPRKTSAAEIRTRHSIFDEAVMAPPSRTSRFQGSRRCEPGRGIRC